MAKVLRNLDAVGSLNFDWDTSQKCVGLWATLRDPFDNQFKLEAQQNFARDNKDAYPFTLEEIKVEPKSKDKE